MTTLQVDDQTYGVEFRTRHRFPPKQRHYIRAVTTCVIYRDGLMGIGTAICVHDDQFCRRDGMRLAFARAAGDCKEPSWNTAGLVALLDDYWPAPTPRQRRPKQPLSDLQLEALRNAPAAIAKRNARLARR